MRLNIEKLDFTVSRRAYDDITRNNISGCSVAVADKNGTVYKKHFGTLSAFDSSPLTDDTLFRLASMTKPITAAVVMKLFDMGLVNIEDPVEKYLPQFKNIYTVKMSDKAPKRVAPVRNLPTLKHLLTHTSGLLAGECGAYYSASLPKEADRTLKATVDYYAASGLSFEPFSSQEYSPVAAFDVLAQILQTVTGLSYDELVKRHITEPCGMKNTTFTPTERQWSGLIPMHTKNDGKSGVQQMTRGCVFSDTPCSHFLGGAGLVSSLDDYICFARMLLNKGELDGKRVLSEEAVRLMSSAQVPECIMDGNERWGLGVRVITREEYKYLPNGAFGWSGAYGTHFWVDPVNEITAVYMKNSAYDGGSGAVTAANFEKDVFEAFE